MIVVTGGLGFIGSALVRRLAARGERVRNLDSSTYAADPRRIASVGDLVETRTVDVASGPLDEHLAGASAVVHCAAETHVTRGESDEAAFFRTNVDGTRAVLDAATRCGIERVVHVSTDEVYGPALAGPFREHDKEPGEGSATSAYARSKAMADDLALAAGAVVVRPTNCFGPWQHPEKAVARWIARAVSGAALPVWGDGRHLREWIFVDDVRDAIAVLLDARAPAGAYNVGPGEDPLPNVEVARAIARLAGRDEDAVYLTAYDRPSHDRRYSVDAARIRTLGWKPKAELRGALAATVDWYRANRGWWEPLLSEAESLYDDARARSFPA